MTEFWITTEDYGLHKDIPMPNSCSVDEKKRKRKKGIYTEDKSPHKSYPEMKDVE